MTDDVNAIFAQGIIDHPNARSAVEWAGAAVRLARAYLDVCTERALAIKNLGVALHNGRDASYWAMRALDAEAKLRASNALRKPVVEDREKLARFFFTHIHGYTHPFERDAPTRDECFNNADALLSAFPTLTAQPAQGRTADVYERGQHVFKISGYRYKGRVVASFVTLPEEGLEPAFRYVVQQDETGLLFIFNESQVVRSALTPAREGGQ